MELASIIAHYHPKISDCIEATYKNQPTSHFRIYQYTVYTVHLEVRILVDIFTCWWQVYTFTPAFLPVFFAQLS